VRVAEIAREHGELRERVVLHLVHHDVAGAVRAAAHERELQVKPFHGVEGLLAEHAHADAVDAQPFALLDGLDHRAVAGREVLARAGGHLALVEGRELLAEYADLLVVGQVHHGILGGLVAREPHDALVELLLQVLDGERAAVHAQGDARELLERRAGLGGGDHALVLHADVAEVGDRQLELRHALVDGVQHLHGRVLGHAAAREPQLVHEIVPRGDVRVRLAHVGQDAVDVVAEHGVGRDQVDVVGVERLALGVEQVGDALQEHRGLARARDAAHEEHGHVRVADDRVLLLLDGRRDGRELRRAALRERCQQQRVLDGHRGVEVGAQLVAVQVELAAELQVHLDRAAVGIVARAAVGLVVINLGHGAAPVHDEVAALLVGHARGADVDVLGLVGMRELEPHLREVRAVQEQLGAAQLLGVDVRGEVVALDDAVHGLELGERLELDVGILVEHELVEHVLLVGQGLLEVGFEPVAHLALDLLELRVREGEMPLLLFEYRVHGCLSHSHH